MISISIMIGIAIFIIDSAAMMSGRWESQALLPFDLLSLKVSIPFDFNQKRDKENMLSSPRKN